MERLARLVERGLAETESLWEPIALAYGWLERAGRILANEDGQGAAAVREEYEALLAAMAAGRGQVGDLAGAVDHFLKVSASYGPHLYHCYEIAGLPRTNNDLEHYFASARYLERRASGRKGASPTLVVRGAVRVLAAVATACQRFGPAQLRPRDLDRWRQLRRDLEGRHEGRRAQLRFRRDPQAYLANLEKRLLQPSLPP